MAYVATFGELDCWKVGTELRRDMLKLIKTFPPEEKYELVSQVRRASRSVTNNIAEGFGRYHYQEFIQFCRISRGSLSELADHMIIANDEKYITKEDLVAYRSRIEKCTVLLNGFIKYLKRKKSESGSSVAEPPLEYSIHIASRQETRVIDE